MKLTKQIKTLSCFLLGWSLLSCSRIDLADPAAVTLVADWSERSAGLPIPTSYTVQIDDRKWTFEEPSNRLPDHTPGNYTAFIYHQAAHISIQGTTAHISAKEGLLQPLPGWLFTAVADIRFEDNAKETITVPMRQQIRSLTIKLKPTGGTADRIRAINAKLTGIAGAWDFGADQPVGPALAVPLDFTKQTDGYWTATVRLLGTVESSPQLIGTVSFEQGQPADLTLQADLSRDLHSFNENKHLPVSLSASVETYTEADFEVVINDWIRENDTGIAW